MIPTRTSPTGRTGSYHEQDDYLEQRRKEWERNQLYAGNRQYLAYHRDLRRWFPRRSAPWRIRSIYNVVTKAIRLRVARLTENKPTVTIQPSSLDRDDIEAAESKDLQFWAMWEKLEIHSKLKVARRWAASCGTGFLKAGWNPNAGEREPVTKFIPRMEPVRVPVTDRDGAPMLDESGQPVTQEDEIERQVQVFLNAKGKPADDVESFEEDEEAGERVRTRNEPGKDVDFINEGEISVNVRSPYNIRWDRWTDDIWESWIVQDADILPASTILGLWPDAEDKLKEATPASEAEKVDLQWEGLSNLETNLQGLGYSKENDDQSSDQVGTTNVEYMVRETWVFPKNAFVRKLWGDDGALLITVGGVLVRKLRLPKWALRKCPFVAIQGEHEPGNHYNRPFLRDLIPLQDDINRSRSHMAEGMSVASRMIIGSVQNSQVNLKLAAQMPMVFLTYKTPAHKPEVLKLDANTKDAVEFYSTSLEAARDVGDMNEASTGRLPSAGLAAKAIYALQFADERSITEVSQDQDKSLRRLAMAMDAVARSEYTEHRTIKIVGENRSYVTERELKANDLLADVDYRFQPGSMLSRQKEAVRNELFQLYEAQLIDAVQLKKMLPSSVPDGIRGSYDAHEARARRQLQKLKVGELEEPDVQQWDDPSVHVDVLQEWLVSAKFEAAEPELQQRIANAWQVYQQILAQQQQPQLPPEEPEPGGEAEPAVPIGAEGEGNALAAGAAGLEEQASAIAPPAEFEERGNPALAGV